MDARPQGLPLSTTQATPSTPAAKVSYCSTSGIRAPLTVDSDIEYPLSTHENSSCSYSSDGVSESDGFVSGEEDFERNSERPFFANPDDETLEETRYLKLYAASRPSVSVCGKELTEHCDVKVSGASRPFVTDHYEESREQSFHVGDYVDSRPFVDGADEEDLETHVEGEDEYSPHGDAPIVDIGVLLLPKPAMPIAQLSGNSDDDSVHSEVVEDDGFSGAIRVPVIGVSDDLRSAPRVKVRCVGEEEDESDSENALEPEVVEDLISGETGSVVLVSSEEDVDIVNDAVKDSYSTVLVEDVGPDVIKEVKFEYLMASKDFASLEDSSVDDNENYLVEEVELPKVVKQQTKINENGTEEKYSVEIDKKVAFETGFGNREMVIDINDDREVDKQSTITAAVSFVIEHPVKSRSLEADKSVGRMTEADFVVSRKGADGSSVSETGQVDFRESADASLVSGLPNHGNKETKNSELLGANSAVTNIVKQSNSFGTVEPNLQELNVDVIKVDRIHKKSGVDLEGGIIYCWESDNEKQESKTEQRIKSVVESRDSVAAEKTDSAIKGTEIQGMDCTKISESDAAGKMMYFTNGRSPETTESYVMEDEIFGKFNIPEPASSNVDAELKEETKGETYYYPINLAEGGEGALSDDDAENKIVEDSNTAKQIAGESEQRLDPTPSAGKSSHDHLFVEEQVVLNSDVDVETDTDGETEGREIFYSAALVALLKAATGAVSEGDGVTFTSADGSGVFSLERPAGLRSYLRPLGPTVQPNHSNLYSSLKLTSGGDRVEILGEAEKEKLEKLQQIQVKYLRLVQRLGQSFENSIVAQVLHRLVVAAGRHPSQVFSLDSARWAATELEANGENDLSFSLNILVIGKTGVGKSATINSIFGEEKTTINAFEPTTAVVQEITGTIDGVKLRILDTPGLISSQTEQRYNRKILLSVKKFIKKFPPDVVLFVDRADTPTRDLNDWPLVHSITSYLGSSIWGNAIITLTHGASTPPDGPSGSPLSCDVLVAQKLHLVQRLISHAGGDLHVTNSGLLNPVSVVENHPLHETNENGESWRSHLLLLCYSMKILSETSSVVKTMGLMDHQNLFGFRFHKPPVHSFLSLLMLSNAHPKLPSDEGIDKADLEIELEYVSDSDEENEDKFDQLLPPFKPLKKSQITKLTKKQRKAYFEEYDYRIKLHRKKQWTEEMKRFRDMKKNGINGMNDGSYMDGYGSEETLSPAIVPALPDMELPPSFDSDYPAYRFRGLEPTSQLNMRPIFYSNGWDHDHGYDGVDLEQNLAIAGRFPALIAVKLRKDKQEFYMHLNSSVSAKHGENTSTMAGVDIQTIGKQLAYVLKGETKIKNFKVNKTASGLSFTFLGENVVPGFKIEDQVVLGKQLVLVGSAGAIQCQGSSAYAANLEVRFREKDFPTGQDQTTVGLSLNKWKGEQLWGCNLQSQFSVGRSSKLAVHAALNNKLNGQISVRASSSEQLQIAILGLVPLARTIIRNLFPQPSEKYSI